MLVGAHSLSKNRSRKITANFRIFVTTNVVIVAALQGPTTEPQPPLSNTQDGPALTAGPQPGRIR